MIRFIKEHWNKIISILLAILFLYAAVSKALDFENFQIQLAQSPLLSAYAGFISYTIIIAEILVSTLLFMPRTNRLGLFTSLGLMSAFTIYIYLILHYSDFIPCSCGGILEKLGWTEHLIFNLFFVFLTIVAILWSDKLTKPHQTILKRGIISVVVIIGCCLIVIGLFLQSEHVIKKENNFTRRFLLNPIANEKVFNMGSDSYYFAGINNDRIYLGSTTAPLWLTSINLQLKDTAVVRLYLDRSDYPFRYLQTRVKDGYYYLFDGSVPIIYRGAIGSNHARTISKGDAYFTQMVVLDTSEFALRSQSRRNKQYILAKLKLDSRPKIIVHENILKKQIDGVFDSDGRLLSDNKFNKLVYVYGYRNQIIKMNNNLNVLDTFRTIDTISQVRISVAKLSDGTYKMNAPPFRINKIAWTECGYLYNESNLKGKHESSAAWRNSAVIDIYNTDKMEYVGSFYIKKRSDEKISGMIANGKFVYVLIGNELRRLQLRNVLLN